MTKRKKIIIFDGDDTLWQTQELYDSKKKQFKDLMHTQGFMENDIIEQMDQLDSERVKLLKLSRKRFLESMLFTYAILCGKYNKKWDIHTEAKIRELGFGVFATPKLYPDTVKTLEILSKYYKLVLFTAGDKKIQKKKINSLGKEFKAYFYKIYIPEIKTVQELKKIFNELKVRPKNVWIVGNSIKSDINPAIELGANAILVSRGSWKYEESRLFLNDILIVNSLSDAYKFILKQENLTKSGR